MISISSERLQALALELKERFHIECAICKVFERRWSYVTGTKDFLGGQHRLEFGGGYGIIIDSGDDTLASIEDYIKQSEVRWSNEESCNH
ncbi:MAG: hypothetical protein JXO44_04195 [Clostridia bacterium]|nr:hypothetical protein [Clostridia bacterium]